MNISSPGSTDSNLLYYILYHPKPDYERESRKEEWSKGGLLHYGGHSGKKSKGTFVKDDIKSIGLDFFFFKRDIARRMKAKTF